MGVVSLRGNIFQRRHGSTPRYRQAILPSNIQEGNEVARVCAMARVVLYIGRTRVLMERRKLSKKSGLTRMTFSSLKKVIASPLLHHSVVEDYSKGTVPRILV